MSQHQRHLCDAQRLLSQVRSMPPGGWRGKCRHRTAPWLRHDPERCDPVAAAQGGIAGRCVVHCSGQRDAGGSAAPQGRHGLGVGATGMRRQGDGCDGCGTAGAGRGMAVGRHAPAVGRLRWLWDSWDGRDGRDGTEMHTRMVRSR